MRKVMCPYCGQNAEHVSGDVIYPDNQKLHHLWYYFCRMCNAWVGTHKDNHYRPYGQLADLYTRQARSRAHKIFDKFWDTKKERTELYKDLAKVLNISERDCHIGKFNQEMCNKVIKMFSNFSEWTNFAARWNGDNI